MTEPSSLRGGELNAAVTSALVGIHNTRLGRGPRTASTFHHGHVIVTLMYGVMTPAEKTVTATGNATTVASMRHLLQEAMRVEFNDAIERLTGRKVVAFMSANSLEPDVASEIFVLDADL